MGVQTGELLEGREIFGDLTVLTIVAAELKGEREEIAIGVHRWNVHEHAAVELIRPSYTKHICIHSDGRKR